MLQEPQIERREHHNDRDVYYQPRPELVSEEQDVHADHDGYHREHVKHNGYLSSHRFFLLYATERNKSGAGSVKRLRWLNHDAGLRVPAVPSISQHRDDESLRGTGLVRGELQRATGIFTSANKQKG
jgi:hypothetical protein